MGLNEYDDDRQPGGDWPVWIDWLGRTVVVLDRWLRWPATTAARLVGVVWRLVRPADPPAPVCSCPAYSAMVADTCPVHGPQLGPQ